MAKKKKSTAKGPPARALSRPAALPPQSGRPQTSVVKDSAAPAPAIDAVYWPLLPEMRLMPTLAMQAHFDHTQWWPADRLERFQLRQIQNLIAHAHAHVPFYRDRLTDVAGLPMRALTMDMFRRIPILKRTDIQNAGDDFIAKVIPRGHGIVHNIRTSGSTGRPLEIKGTGLTGMFYRALGLRSDLWHRRDFFGKLVALKNLTAGQTEKRVPNWSAGLPSGLGVQLNLSLPVGTLLDKILAEDPDYLQVHASTLRELIRLSRETGRKPASLRGIKTESEMVEPDMRDLCAREWGVRLTDVYSCQEISIMAIECFDAPVYHVQSEVCLLEVLDDDDNPCAPGQTGRVVVTSLHNFASPLIRYELGDFATVGHPCPCGRGLPVLERIAGRLRNLAVLPSGEKVTPVLNSERVLNDLPIRQFQLIQKSVDEIEARIAAKRPLTADDEKTFADYFRRGLGHDFPFTFVYVDEIPRQANGKYEVFRCEVAT